MVTPLVHMGLGYDDLLVPALVHAGFETKDLVLVVRTDANLAWVRRHAPRATTVRLPYAAARKANVVSGLAPHAALKRACAGVGLDPLDLLVSERALRRNRVDTAMNFLNLAAEELEAVIADRGPMLALGLPSLSALAKYSPIRRPTARPWRTTPRGRNSSQPFSTDNLVAIDAPATRWGSSSCMLRPRLRSEPCAWRIRWLLFARQSTTSECSYWKLPASHC